MVFDLETLQMLFEELGLDFDDWADEVGYTSSWTDPQIYTELPPAIKEEMADIVMNTSWWHDGM